MLDTSVIARPCPICTSYVCDHCAAHCRGCEALARRHAVAKNPPSTDPLLQDTAEGKLAYLVQSLGPERDVLFQPWGVFVRALEDSRHYPYIPDLDSTVLGHLRFRTHIKCLDRPMVACLESGIVWQVTQPVPTQLVWFLPQGPNLELRFRLPKPEQRLVEPIEIPSNGPLALPAPWTMPPPPKPRLEPRIEVLATCPHCGTCSSVLRLMKSVYVCSPCGRSFTRPELGELPRFIVDE